MRLTIPLLSFFSVALAHGGHEHDGPKDGESMENYAERHMATEHHINGFDLDSFFALHDLNSDHVLDPSEIEAIYGVHHTDSQKKSPDEAAHAAKARRIVSEVLARMDTNKDGYLTVEEFRAAGFAGLPDFSSLGAEGHHYDEESEFFLHHEEVYHNTPETQTDDAYNHPEDIAHFENHERLEVEEENKERAFEGLPPLAPGEHPGEHPEPPSSPEVPLSKSQKFTRLRDTNKQDPKDKFHEAGKEALNVPDWGEGDLGFKQPKTPAEKLRRNVPYKYKFRRNWGDF